MKFHHSTTTIAIYFVFIGLWMNLFSNASEDENISIINKFDDIITQAALPKLNYKNKTNIPDLNNIATQNVLQNVLQPKDVKIIKSPFQTCCPQILFTIFNQLLTIRDILILRKTCIDFKILLIPNGKIMFMQCKNFSSKEILTGEPLLWCDLEYLLHQSHANVLEKMKIFNIKENQYAIFTHEQNIKLIVSNYGAFAALLENGSVIAWGDLYHGGSIPDNIQTHLLKNVKTIHSTNDAFAALLENGNFVTWDYDCGGIFFPMQVKIIFSNNYAFVALLEDGDVISWGSPTTYQNCGGFIPESVQIQLFKNVKTIVSTSSAFAALLENGSVIVWGNEYYGGKISSETAHQLKNVKTIISNKDAFAALLENGSVIAWGNEYRGGKIYQHIQVQLKQNVNDIFSNNYAFSALLKNGNVISWGNQDNGGKIPDNIQTQLKNVKMICSTKTAFAALLENGNVFAWGNEKNGGKITTEIQIKLKNVKVIVSSISSFFALVDNGSVFTWGNPETGGEISDEVQSKLMKNIKMIFPERRGFRALCNNGEMMEVLGHNIENVNQNHSINIYD